MSKIAAYLQEHIQGEVITNAAALKAYSTDASILEIAPEMVVYPRVTSDIRKVARFAWQLADKGHILAITARGSGSDQTGGAIGKGVIMATPAHMDQILEFDAKQKLIRLQPGISTRSLMQALSLHGLGIPAFMPVAACDTVGGAIGKGASSLLAQRYGGVDQWVHQLEVVLASGDVLQTQRLSKRDLNRKKGLQGLEGEIYRQLDNLITDNQQLINDKLAGLSSNVGYAGIAKVKQKDGSFDLAPLIVGSQGTLGIVSEMILKVDFVSNHEGAALITFSNKESARDALDHLVELEPAFVEYFDENFFKLAKAQGKSYDFYDTSTKAIMLVGFKEFSERANNKKLRKLSKKLQSDGVQVTTALDGDARALEAIRDVCSYTLLPAGPAGGAAPLFDGVYIPRERLEEFIKAAATLASKYGIEMPIYGQMLGDLIFTRPTLQPNKVGDKQKLFKLLDEMTALTSQYGGYLVGTGSEGRVKAPFAYKQLDDDVVELFKAIKAIFDPYGILNPGVKQTAEPRQLVPMLRSSYDYTHAIRHIPSF